MLFGYRIYVSSQGEFDLTRTKNERRATLPFQSPESRQNTAPEHQSRGFPKKLPTHFRAIFTCAIPSKGLPKSAESDAIMKRKPPSPLPAYEKQKLIALGRDVPLATKPAEGEGGK